MIQIVLLLKSAHIQLVMQLTECAKPSHKGIAEPAPECCLATKHWNLSTGDVPFQSEMGEGDNGVCQWVARCSYK